MIVGRPTNLDIAMTVISVILLTASATSAKDASTEDDIDANSNTLWRIVSKECTPEKETNKPVTPCINVVIGNGLERGFAIIKDITGVAQFLVIPTKRIKGIEEVNTLAPWSGVYWEAAWYARFFVFGMLQRQLARDQVVLAINSREDRTQNQLHIHVDCIRSDIRDMVVRHFGELGYSWSPFPVPLDGKKYNVRLIDEANLGKDNPFELVAQQTPEATADMGDETIVLIGADFANDKYGFILLEDRVGRVPGDKAHGEDLMDHQCTVAGK